MRPRCWVPLVIALATVHAGAGAQEGHKDTSAAGASAAATQHDRDVEALRRAIVRSGEAFNARDPDAIMAQYADDVVVSYPGIPDMDYAAFAKAYAEIRGRPPGVTVRTSPTIEEILVSGDLGVVRVTWTTTETSPARTATRRMKDLQVWRRERDGTWKFARGMHYRMPAPDSSGAADRER